MNGAAVIRLSPEAMLSVDTKLGIRHGENKCPTCHAIGDETCVRGRFPSAIWQEQIPFPEGHDSRRSATARQVSA